MHPEHDGEPTPVPPTAPPMPDPLHGHLSVDLRNTSLSLIALLASLFFLRWASAIVIPVLTGLMFSSALLPVVAQLQRWRIPQAVGAALLMIAILGGLGSMVFSLSDDASALVESLPDAAQKLRDSVRSTRGAPEGAIDKVQRAAAKLERAAEESGSSAPAPGKGVTRVQIERAHFNIKDYLWTGTLGLAGAAGQATVVLFITYFLLASGSHFRRKMVKIAGPAFSQKKNTIQVLDEISGHIQRYLMVQIFTSALVGVVTWVALLCIGVERAAVWGIAAAVLNFVPYVGSIAITVGLMLVGFLQFGTLAMALLVGGVSLLIHTLSGNLLTPWLTSRASRMSPVAIFIGVLAWGWLLGIWGLLLGAPLMMAIKTVCDHVDQLKPIGELLGE